MPEPSQLAVFSTDTQQAFTLSSLGINELLALPPRATLWREEKKNHSFQQLASVMFLHLSQHPGLMVLGETLKLNH